MDNLSRLFGTGRVISFPTGSPPDGTCEFATKKCLEECDKFVHNFPHEYKAYELFRKLSVGEIILRLSAELQNNAPLSWFAESGDCPTNMTQKVIEVMKGLFVPQNGFTRNKQLWKLSQAMPHVRIVLTEENKKTALDYAKIGMVAIPIYQEQRVKILRDGEKWICGGGGVDMPDIGWTPITCGCGNVETEEEITEENCSVCLKLLRGCYAA